MTNYDKKMAEMTVNKMAFLLSLSIHSCEECPLRKDCYINNKNDIDGFYGCIDYIKTWLESEAKNDPAE